jgi:hypothetical protein
MDNFPYPEMYSNCCGKKMEDWYLDTEICPKCKEHCEPITSEQMEEEDGTV